MRTLTSDFCVWFLLEKVFSWVFQRLRLIVLSSCVEGGGEGEAINVSGVEKLANRVVGRGEFCNVTWGMEVIIVLLLLLLDQVIIWVLRLDDEGVDCGEMMWV